MYPDVPMHALVLGGVTLVVPRAYPALSSADWARLARLVARLRRARAANERG